MSVDPFSLFEGGASSMIVEGVVSRAPADKQHGMYVTNELELGAERGPMSWPRDGDTLPVVGDRAWIALPVNGDPVCIAWQHYPDN